MADWSADPLAAAIERRRHRCSAYAKSAREDDPEARYAEARLRDWAPQDWTRLVERREACEATYRDTFSVTIKTKSGLLEKDVHMFDLKGSPHAWRAYAWEGEPGPDGGPRPRTRLHSPKIQSPEDAVLGGAKNP